MSENTKKRSLDKLFGSAPNVRTPKDEEPATARPVEGASPSARSRKGGAPAGAPATRSTSRTAAKPTASRTRVSSAVISSTGSEDRVVKPDDDAGPGGYLGKSRYRRGDGVLVKPSIYVRPDQAHALRMSAAAKDDPNGETMSEIIQALLDQHGYCDPKHRL